MTVEINYETIIPHVGMIKLYSEGSFEEELAVAESDGAKLITARDLAYVRIKIGNSFLGKKHSLLEEGSYVNEGSLFVPNGKVKRYLLRDSLLVKNHLKLNYEAFEENVYFLDDKFNVNKFLEKLSQEDYLAIKDMSAIPATRFGEDERTVWLFKDQAKEYGKLLADAKIETTAINMYDNVSYATDPENKELWIDKREKPFAAQMHIGGIGHLEHHISGQGNDYVLCAKEIIRGVVNNIKTLPPYLNKDLERQTKILRKVKTGELKA